VPTGKFLLEAFDETANLSELAFAAQRLILHFDETVKPRIEKKVREAAVEAGLDPDLEVKNCGLGMIYQLEIAIENAVVVDRGTEPSATQ